MIVPNLYHNTTRFHEQRLYLYSGCLVDSSNHMMLAVIDINIDINININIIIIIIIIIILVVIDY